MFHAIFKGHNEELQHHYKVFLTLIVTKNGCIFFHPFLEWWEFRTTVLKLSITFCCAVHYFYLVTILSREK